jgi:hypothetical protein
MVGFEVVVVRRGQYLPSAVEQDQHALGHVFAPDFKQGVGDGEVLFREQLLL